MKVKGSRGRDMGIFEAIKLALVGGRTSGAEKEREAIF